MHGESFNEATSFFPEVDDYGSAIDSYLELIENAKMAIDIPVIASLNGANIGGWVKYARLLEGAGADALELNLYTVAADPDIAGSALEAEHLELVALVAEEVSVPVAVKISPYYSSVSSFVVGLQRSGAAGVVMFNRFYSPDLDLETLEVAPRIALEHTRGTPPAAALDRHPARAPHDVDRRLDGCALRLRRREADPRRRRRGDVDVVAAAPRSGPSPHDRGAAVRLDETSTTTSRWSRCVEPWPAMPPADPAAYERANYIGNIATYTSRFIGTGAVPLARHRPE